MTGDNTWLAFTCPRCHGDGVERNPYLDQDTCSRCEGTGEVQKQTSEEDLVKQFGCPTCGKIMRSGEVMVQEGKWVHKTCGAMVRP